MKAAAWALKLGMAGGGTGVDDWWARWGREAGIGLALPTFT